MKFHDYKTLWSEMQGKIPPQVTEEMSVPKIVLRKGSVVHREVLARVPTGLAGERDAGTEST